MPNNVRIRTTVDGAKQGTKEVHDLRSAFDTLQKQGAKGLAIGIGAGATTAALGLVGSAVGAVTDFIHDDIQAASDLNETMSKSSVVFGKSATSVSQWGEKSAVAFGLSKRAAIESAASFGNVFKGLGFASDKSAEMSERLVALAGDLASFNNIDPTEALEKLRSGLAGESEPLRTVGVFLTEAKVKAKAMELGLADAHGELSEGAKIMARYQLILDETKTAQGDFARTADGVANSQRRLNAEIENQQARLGQKLLPLEKTWLDVQENVLGALADNADLTDRVAKARDIMGRSDRAAMDVAVALGKALEVNADTMATDETEARRLAVALGKSASSSTDLGDAAKTGAKGLGTLEDQAKDAAKAARDLDSDISDLTDTIVDELYGDTIRAGKEADLKGQIHDLSRELDSTTNRRKALELKGQIAELRGELFNLHLEEAARKGPQAAIDFLKRERAHAGEAKDEIDKLIKKYAALADLQGDLGPIIVVGGAPHGPARKRRAGGGPVVKGEAYTVGEEGPETFVAPANGTIIPTGGGLPTAGSSMEASGTTTAASVAPSWGPLNVNVTVSGGVMTPGVTDELARNLGPAITRYMQQRGIIAGARAF